MIAHHGLYFHCKCFYAFKARCSQKGSSQFAHGAKLTGRAFLRLFWTCSLAFARHALHYILRRGTVMHTSCSLQEALGLKAFQLYKRVSLFSTVSIEPHFYSGDNPLLLNYAPDCCLPHYQSLSRISNHAIIMSSFTLHTWSYLPLLVLPCTFRVSNWGY